MMVVKVIMMIMMVMLCSNPKHESELLENNVGKIDLVVINLYPFDSTGTSTDVPSVHA
jgi:AICAR transformylase/IMP cyclohydrolase PurH